MPHFTKPAEGSWTEHYPQLGTAPVSYEDSISPEFYEQERAAYIEKLRAEYEEDIDIVRLAGELVVDAIVEPEDLRADLIARLTLAGGKDRSFSDRIHGVPPV